MNELQTLSAITNKRLLPILDWNRDEEQASQVLSALNGKETVFLSCIYNKDGSIFSYHQRHSEELTCPDFGEAITEFTTTYLSYKSVILTHDNKDKAFLYIKSNMSEVYNSMVKLTIGVLIIFLIAMTMAYIIARLMKILIADPIIELSSIASQVEKGNYEIRAKKFNNDEVGRLSTTFNSMMEYIQERDALLEEMVIERTAKLQDALKDAEAASFAKSEFLANMSHELRTPIHGIMNFAKFGMNDIKKEKLDSNKMLKYLNNITTSSTRMSKLIDHLLDLSKSEAGMVEYNFERKDIIDITNRTVSELSSIFDTKNLTVNIRSSETEMFVYIDELRIIQVIYNIMSNAIKFSERQSPINIDIIYLDNNQISVSISNTGVGIMEEELEKVFDKFIQGTKTKTGAGGTGLGLSISKGIIEAHDGKIWAENGSDDRTIFIFTLPTQLTAKQITENYHKIGVVA
jgi:signal transduction histidine kinase